MSEVITTDSAFSKAQQDTLEVIVEMIIPAEDDMPGAADAKIFQSILTRMGESVPAVTMAIDTIDELSMQRANNVFLQLKPEDRQPVISAFRSSHPELAQLLQLNTVASYYQDDSVMTAIGLEARPPHPGGYEVEKTDWSILDPVRAKEKIYRSI